MGEQSGIVAGRGGYDVTAGGKVDLTGGVISSTAEPQDNVLSARELAWRDVQNSSASSSSGFGVGFGVNFGSAETEAGKDVAARYPGTLTPIVNMPAREGGSGTTRATVTPGTLELSDQRQDLASLNRDAGAAHVSVEAYDIARLKARQEGAAALSELLNGLTGDLSAEIGLKDGDPAKAALHAAVGAAVAAVAGTDIGAGAAAGLVSELANGVVSQMLKDHPELTTAQTDAIRQWTATALGAAIGGQAGAAAALDNIKHNYLKHEEQLQLEAAEAACKAGDQAACEEQQRLEEKDAVQQQQLLACYQSGYQGDGCAAVFADMVAALSSYSGIATFLLSEEDRAKMLTGNRGSVEQIFKIMAPEGVDKLSEEKLKELNNLVNLLVGDPTGVTAAPVLLDDILNGNFSDAGARLVSIFSRKVIKNGAIGVGKGVGAPNTGAGGFYDPHAWRKNYDDFYNGNVTSTTVPPYSAKNVHLAGQRHPETGVVFDQRGYPIFDSHTAYDTRFTGSEFGGASYQTQMRMATRDLRKTIEINPQLRSQFNSAQLQAIQSGDAKIPGYTWHHHQDSGRMHLFDETVHRRTGHIGAKAMSGGQ